MKLIELEEVMHDQDFFDLATVALLSGEKRETLRAQLSRWCRSGKLLALRRGMYAFPARGTARRIHPALLANKLYPPSYISGLWALGYYGLIPEKVVTYTSVTQRVTRSFENSLGVFRYQSIKASAFFGYGLRDVGNEQVLLADPEKALLDLWHLERGSWDAARMEGMRFQNRSLVNLNVLRDYAERYDSPRLIRAAELWACMPDEEAGGVEL